MKCTLKQFSLQMRFLLFICLLPVSYLLLYIDVESRVSVLCVFQWEGITCHRICGILPPFCLAQTDPCVFISSTPTNDCVFDTDGEY